ncbi:MAG: hypothetical protein JW839_16675 [Candidatus Lokiarchaeota archaeon]|nr:hypothetical protein [Candidatus Lokiarchaeota archaeon]
MMTRKMTPWKTCAIVMGLACTIVLGTFAPIQRHTTSNSVGSSSIPSDAPLDWTASTLPALLTNQLEKNYTGNKAGDDFWVPTDSIVLQTNITVRNIRVEPILYTVESYVLDAVNASGLFETLYFQQIRIPSSCYVPWISLFTQFLWIGHAASDWTISIWNATADAYQMPFPGEQIAGSAMNFNPAYESVPYNDIRYNMPHWENVTMPAVALDTINTYRYNGFYHFFVAVRMPSYFLYTTDQFWFFNNDTVTSGSDEGRAFARPWQLLTRETTELQGVDFTLAMRLVPVSTSVAPEAIGLRVNGEPVIGTGSNNGRYDSNEQFRATGGRVYYSVTSDWSNLQGGVTRCDLEITYVHGAQLEPRLRVTVPDGSTTARWNATFDVDFDQLPSFPVAMLYLNVPLSWTNLTFINTTGATPQSVPHSIALGPTGKYWSFLAGYLVPGEYTLTCDSSIVAIGVELGLNGDGSVDLDGMLNYNTTITGGLNGRPASLQSDYEGFVSWFRPTSGTADGDITSRLQVEDGKGIQFGNTLIPDLAYILSILNRDLSTNVGPLNVSSEFCLGIDPSEGFASDNIQDIELIFDYESFNESIGIANLTAMNVPDNPAWNVDGVPPKELFWRALLNDTSYIHVNLTYNGAGAHFSDVYFNFTCRGIEAGAEIGHARVTEIDLWFTMNFSTPVGAQEIYMKNQSSGSFVQLQGVQTILAGNRPYISWNSSQAPGTANWSQFVKPGQNVVEVFVRSFNATYVDPTSTQVVGVNMALEDFKYTNTFKNFTFQFFNWTSGEYMNLTHLVVPETGDATLSIPLNGTVPSLLDIFNGTSNEIRVRFTANSIVPILNTASVWVDRIMVVVVYEGYQRFWWEHDIVDAEGVQTLSVQNQTLFDAPANNFSSSMEVNAFIDLDEGYQFQAFWNNGTDIAIWTEDFTVNKIPVALHVSEAFLGESILENDFVSIGATLTYGLNGTGIAGKTLYFTLYIVTREGLNSELDLSGVTDASGAASVGIQASPSWQSFYVVARFETDDVRLSPETSAPTRRAEVLSMLDYVVRIITNNALLIITIAALVVILFIAKRGQDSKRRHGWAVDAGRLRDARKIRHLMVIHSSGSCIFERSYSQQNLDADLVSGFLTAITSFGKEVGPRGTKAQGEDEAMYFDYQNFKILIANGKYCKGAIILEGEPTENLKSNLKYFVSAFEQRYSLESWRGNVSMFSTADDLVEASFEISLIQPLVAKQGAKPAAEKAIPTGLGKALYQVAATISAEQGYFVLSTLAMYAPISKKIPKDQVLAEIYRLKKQGFIVPYRYYT